MGFVSVMLTYRYWINNKKRMKNLFEFMEPTRFNEQQVHLTNVARVLSGMLSKGAQSGAAGERGGAQK